MRLHRSVLILALLVLAHVISIPALAQGRRPADSGTFSPAELVESGHNFFGSVSRGLAPTVEEAVRRCGEPNG